MQHCEVCGKNRGITLDPTFRKCFDRELCEKCENDRENYAHAICWKRKRDWDKSNPKK